MDKKQKVSSKTKSQESIDEINDKLVERLNLATRAAQMGIWDWDIQKNELVWDDQMYRLYGLQPGDFGGAYEAWLNGLHPDDRATSNEASQQAVRGEKEYDTEFRVLWPDGNVHWLKANGQVFRDEEGKPIRMVGVNYDITVRKQTETNLLQSEEKFAALFYQAAMPAVLLAISERAAVDVNTAFENMSGYGRQEILGKNPVQIGMAPSTETPRAFHEFQEKGSLFGAEGRFFTKTGAARDVLINASALELNGKKFALITYQDITGRKQAEKQVIQMKRLYATLSQVNQTIVRVKDRADLYQSICDVSTKFGEFALAWIGLLNETTGDVMPVAASGLDLAQWPFPQINIYEGAFKNGLTATALRTSKVVTSEDIMNDERTRSSAASVVNNDYHAAAIVPFQLKGKTIGMLSLVSHDADLFKAQEEALLLKEMSGDISFALDTMETESARNQAEEKVQNQLQRLNSLHKIDNAITSNETMDAALNVVLEQAVGLLKADAAMILLFNESQQRLEYAAGLGFRSASATQSQLMLGQGLASTVGLSRKVLHIPDISRSEIPFIRAQIFKEDQFVEYVGVPLIAKDSLKGVLEIFNRTSTNPNAEWLHIMEVLGGQAAIAIDNSQLFEQLQRSNAELEQRVKARTADLVRMNAELEHANRTKDEFLANMSHELRTPLTGILGLTESLQFNTYGQVNEKQFQALQNINTSGRHLLELINDILDLSKIEAGKLDIYPEMLNIQEVCRTSLMFVKEQAHKKSIDLQYQPAEDAKSIFADPRRLKQILVNLLSNAVKFTPEKGRIELSVQTDHVKGQIHFTVTDTGIGIAPEDLERLFTPFTQVDSRLNRQYEGTGLGLVLILRLAEMHGGNVQVESQVGQGSRFTVSLPWQSQASGQSQNQAEQVQLSNPEKNTPNGRGVVLLAEDNQTNILAMGDYLQFKGYTLVTAVNGMDALVKAEEHQPQLILMDIQMPVMDGLEATRRLRANPRFATTPIIALTALAMTGDRERCLQAGANDYLSKPVILKELAEKIEKLLQ